jgi:hypothetical protein
MIAHHTAWVDVRESTSLVQICLRASRSAARWAEGSGCNSVNRNIDDFSAGAILYAHPSQTASAGFKIYFEPSILQGVMLKSALQELGWLRLLGEEADWAAD